MKVEKFDRSVWRVSTVYDNDEMILLCHKLWMNLMLINKRRRIILVNISNSRLVSD